MKQTVQLSNLVHHTGNKLDVKVIHKYVGLGGSTTHGYDAADILIESSYPPRRLHRASDKNGRKSESSFFEPQSSRTTSL
jgi:hypothetical protein